MSDQKTLAAKHSHNTKSINQYLDRYAEPESKTLTTFSFHFEQGLVIPIYRESPSVLIKFRQFAEQQAGTLLVMVVNQPDSDQHADWLPIFTSPLEDQTIQWQSSSKQLTLYLLANNSGLLLIDRCTTAIPKDQGVGLARKIGNDVLLALTHQQHVRSHWMANTDADVQLPADYFLPLQNLDENTCSDTKIAAAIYPFQHIFIDNSDRLPTQLYEFSLHYYVAGLMLAKSKYAYHTIGSIIAVNYHHYPLVRGFPKRAGAEDFYLLNKLAKTGAIHQFKEPQIAIEARASDRVPFGTGPAVIKLSEQPDPKMIQLYHPDSFIYLHAFIQLLEALATQKTTTTQASETIALRISNPIIQPQLLQQLAERLDASAAVEHCHRNGKTVDSRIKHIHHWFDGFKTLKFIHTLRDLQLGTISFHQWCNDFQTHSLAKASTLKQLTKQINTKQ
jgi:hypothetical protein